MASVRNVTFRSGDLPLMNVVNALKDGHHDVIVAKAVGTPPDRWNVCLSETGKPAIFTHVLVWDWGSSIDTGNFVPQGKVAPSGLPEKRIQRSPSATMCEFSYAFKTIEDKSLFSAMEAFEQYASQIEGFNPSGKQKANWQAGDTADVNRRFIMTSKMFVRRTDANCTPNGTYKVPYTVHPWIREYVNPLRTRLVPNKDKPRLFTINDDDVLARLEDSDPNTFQENDLIWVSFKIHYSIRAKVWAVEFTPLELVRVGHQYDGGQGEEEEDDGFTPIEAGVAVRRTDDSDDDKEGAEVAVAEPLALHVESKRKRSESTGSERGSKVIRQEAPVGMEAGMDIEGDAGTSKGHDVPMGGADAKVVRGRRAGTTRRG